MGKRKISKEIALFKVKAICSLQEKCSYDIKEKLIKWQLSETQVNGILKQLINENYINDERYAKAFANDKFKFNKWGKQKIKYVLMKKDISDSVIQKAIDEIDSDEYYKLVKDELQKKRNSIKGKNIFELKSKLIRFASSRGFEPDVLYPAIESILKE